MSFITREDIKDNVVEGFDLTDYLVETDNEITDLGESLGVVAADIPTTLPYKIKRYAVVFCVLRLCQDKMGTNNVDLPEIEKYAIKFTTYNKELERLRKQITYEMFVDNVLEIRDRAIVSGTIFRG